MAVLCACTEDPKFSVASFDSGKTAATSVQSTSAVLVCELVYLYEGDKSYAGDVYFDCADYLEYFTGKTNSQGFVKRVRAAENWNQVPRAGKYTAELSGLSPDKTYYFAPVLGENAVARGDIQSFKTKPSGSDYSFSVSSTLKVYFSPGNLQYNPAQGVWRFADKQYAVVGASNSKIKQTYDGWIDLFGFGTSGYVYQPWTTTEVRTDYATQSIMGTNHDWGRYCTISNGQTYKGKWRTLTSDEWAYMFDRGKSSRATVVGVKGMLLLPDKWTTPAGLSFSAKATSYSTNVYDATAWTKMEDAGAVFLPCAGYRRRTSVSDYSDTGIYWSSSWTNGGTLSSGSTSVAQPQQVYFDPDEFYNYAVRVGVEDYYNSYGYSVRLVRDAD